MDTDKTTETAVATETGEAEAESISIPRKEYDTMNQTLGSLKKQIKDFKKAQEEAKEEKTETKADEFGLLQKSYLRSAGIVDEEEIELAKEVQKKTGLEWDALVDDDYFQMKLGQHRRGKENVLATSNIKGGQVSAEVKNSPAYWLAKGAPPMPSQVPNRKDRAKIVRAFMESNTKGKMFYDD